MSSRSVTTLVCFYAKTRGILEKLIRAMNEVLTGRDGTLTKVSESTSSRAEMGTTACISNPERVAPMVL